MWVFALTPSAVSAHRLNLLVAFFFPIATLSAIFSTNFRSGLGQLDNLYRPLPLILLLASGLLLGVVLTVFVTRRSRRARPSNDQNSKS